MVALQFIVAIVTLSAVGVAASAARACTPPSAAWSAQIAQSYAQATAVFEATVDQVREFHASVNDPGFSRVYFKPTRAYKGKSDQAPAFIDSRKEDCNGLSTPAFGTTILVFADAKNVLRWTAATQDKAWSRGSDSPYEDAIQHAQTLGGKAKRSSAKS